jgi:hypothetical protein
MAGFFARGIRGVVVVPLGLVLLSACRLADTTSSQLDAKQAPRTSSADRAVAAVANSGCSLGLAEGDSVARVAIIPRSRLPFQLPSIAAVATTNRPLRMHVVRMAVPAGGARPNAILACLLPANGNYVQRAIASFKQVPTGAWTALAHEAETRGAIVRHDVYRAVAKGLLDSTLHVASVAPISANRLRWPGSGGDPHPLPTVVVTASANVAVFDIYVLRGLFEMSGESVRVTWEMQLAQQQWSQDCDEWNAAMDEYDATKGTVAATADEEAEELENLANQLESALAPLETASASCKPTNGKKMCIDFFIMNCWLAAMAGDCRDFDRNAEYANSRVQLYLDPATRAWEVKYNCSTILNPLTNPPSAYTRCDSSRVFNPQSDVIASPPDANGWTRFDMKFRNNLCVWLNEFACPAIDATVRFRANASAPGGYEILWERDGFPSMGVYVRNAADTDWLVAEEDPQKTKAGVTAIRALAGQIRSKGYNYPPPGGQPPGCFRQ